MSNLRQELTERTGVHLAIGDGWLPLVDRLHRDLLAIDRRHRVGEIKEKFGGLRYEAAFNEATYDAVAERIRKAEDEALRTCDVCGNPGRLVRKASGWYLTVCATHTPDGATEA